MRRLLILLLFTLPSFAATAHVASATPTTASCSSCTITFNSIGANLLVVGIALDSNGTVSSVSDGTNTYTKSTNAPCSDGTHRAYIYYFNYSSNPGNKTITVTNSGTITNETLWADTFSGASGSLDIDTVTSCTGTGTAINSPTITPSVSGDVLYGVCYAAGAISTSGGSWNRDTITNGEDAEWQVNVGTSATAINFTQSPSAGWACMLSAFSAPSTVNGDTIAGPTTWGGNNTIK